MIVLKRMPCAPFRASLFHTLLNLCCLVLLLCPLGCTVNETFAPVIDAWQDPHAMKSRYRVQKDDTIYSIALAFDMDYRDLARANRLVPPYSVKPGQTLTMRIIESSVNIKVTTCAVKNIQSGKKKFIENKLTVCNDIQKNLPDLPTANEDLLTTVPEITLPEVELRSIDYKPEKHSSLMEKDCNVLDLPKKTVEINQAKMIPLSPRRWQWPAKGTIMKEFSLQTGGNKGIDIAGNLGDSIWSVAPGKVVYSGSGLRGYGNLIIIKHSDNFLSAYAYNQKLLVREGDMVKAGAEIGKMGQNDSGQVLLHFEIRRNGKPVNPLLYL